MKYLYPYEVVDMREPATLGVVALLYKVPGAGLEILSDSGGLSWFFSGDEDGSFSDEPSKGVVTFNFPTGPVVLTELTPQLYAKRVLPFCKLPPPPVNSTFQTVVAHYTRGILAGY